MSVYNCEQCSFYTDKNNKLIKHLASQKHRENTERILGNPPSTRTAQTVATHRVLKQENKETSTENVNSSEVVQTPILVTNGFPMVFTLLEVTNNRVVGSRQIDMKNSVIRFVDE